VELLNSLVTISPITDAI